MSIEGPAAPRERHGRAAIVLNLFIPGTGLILLRREWLGLSLAILFGVCAQAAAAGLLIAPAAMPAWLPRVALGLASATWMAAQLIGLRRVREVAAIRASGQVGRLLEAARAGLARGDWAAAESALAGALTLDDEDAAVHVERARLLSARGQAAAARRAWRRAVAVDGSDICRAETGGRAPDGGRPGVGGVGLTGGGSPLE